ncbi:PH domain-containing protein [Hortaea werneckii]|nr:PH domain-containing protein [Hortaea werneckii]
MSTPTSPQQDTPMPTRTATSTTDDNEPIPEEDSSEVTRLFHERLQAWKHACGYLEDYITATEKIQHTHGKEYEKVLKTVSSPLKEGHHFDQSLGGVAGMFDNIRSNTQGISNSHYETAKTLKGSVLPIFERLHQEIKHKTKELTKGAGKGSKAVEKSRNTSQKHIELLGQHTAAFDSTGGSVKSHEDPYIIQRQVYHRLHKQVVDENANREDLIAVQNSFAQFEAHIVQTFQNGFQQFHQVVTNQTDQVRNMYGDMMTVTQKIPPDYEWNGFVKRNSEVLIDQNAPKRSVENIGFPNQDHRSTQPLIAGSLEKKGKMFKSYSAAYYVVTPSKYLHEFKTDDDFAKDPAPEASLYLPDCVIGAVDGPKFNVKGKHVGSKIGGFASHEYAFKAHTPQDAQKWHDAIASVSGQSSGEKPVSPQQSRVSSMGTKESEAAKEEEQESSTTATPAAAEGAQQETGLTAEQKEAQHLRESEDAAASSGKA